MCGTSLSYFLCDSSVVVLRFCFTSSDLFQVFFNDRKVFKNTNDKFRFGSYFVILFQVGNDGLTSLTIRRMTEMRDNNSTIAFIGPDGHYCADEALVSAAWNLPMITHV